jgi:RNA polymerase sigma-70 factor (ECF subfamily)
MEATITNAWFQVMRYFAAVLSGIPTVSIAAHNGFGRSGTRDDAGQHRSDERTKEVTASFLETLNEHQGLIHKICRSWSRKRVDHEDLYGEIVYQLWKNYPSFKGKSKLGTWLYWVALRAAMLPLRQKKIKAEYVDVLPQVAADKPFDDGFDDQMLKLFSELAPVNRSILVLTMEGFNAFETGKILCLSQNAVTKRLNRIRVRIEWTKK